MENESKQIEKVTGYKKKVTDLIQASSEVANYSTILLKDMQDISVLRHNAMAEVDKLNQEKEKVQKSIDALKANFKAEEKSIQEWKDAQMAEVNQQKDHVNTLLKQAHVLGEFTNQKETALNVQLAEFNNKKREFEARNAKIAELVK